MKNYAELSEKLRAARAEEERLLAEAKALSAKEQQGMKEADAQKTRDLVQVFGQFTGHKIANGKATLEAVLRPDTEGNELVWLNVASAGSSVFHLLGARMLAARYAFRKYELFHYDPKFLGIPESTETFNDVDSLLEAVAGAVSRM